MILGFPREQIKKWRQESTEKWLQKLLQEKKQPILLGQIVLGEIVACPSAKLFQKINFCLLDVSDFERVQRLKKRNIYGTDPNMLNWAAWLRMHHKDPQWMQSVLKEECWHGLNFSSWDQLTKWDDKVAITIFDTTNLSIQEVAKSIARWITKE